MKEPISVGQLNGYVKLVVEKQDCLKNVSVFGEISSFKFSGYHAYFNLKDSEGAIACSCFYAKKTYTPTKDGESVICTGSVDYYSKTGRLSLIVETIQPVGKGALHILLEKLKAKLLAEGLFATEHKKPIPPYCKRICVVTSKTGAVIRDIVRTVRNKNKYTDICVYDVRVQGETAATEMCKALTLTDTLGFDCIILARGGGSFEDLMPFNDEQLARTIYSLNTPIISAVGHETDFSISDFVADARAATPTAAAELAAFDMDAVIQAVKARLVGGMEKVSTSVERALERVGSDIGALGDKALRKFDKAESNTLLYCHKLKDKTDALILAKEQKVSKALALLDANNPVKLLKGGYFRLTKQNKNAVFAEINAGDRLDVIGADGTLDVEVIEKRLTDSLSER